MLCLIMGLVLSCVSWPICTRSQGRLANKVCMCCMCCSALFVELLVLLEMVSPQRYHGNEPPVLHATHTQVQWLQLAACWLACKPEFPMACACCVACWPADKAYWLYKALPQLRQQVQPSCFWSALAPRRDAGITRLESVRDGAQGRQPVY